MLTLKHNNKTYQWIGEKWGEVPVKGFSLKISEKSSVYLYEYDSAGGCHYEVQTYHTPEQLVKLGYMEEVEENPENTRIIDEMITYQLDNAPEPFYTKNEPISPGTRMLPKSEPFHTPEDEKEMADMAIKIFSDNIIITRLRKGIIEIRDGVDQQWSNPFSREAAKFTANFILDLLDRIISGETSIPENPDNGDAVPWNPQPGETILVRYEDDARKDPWMPRTFIRMDGIRFVCQIEGGRPGEERSWEIAMPKYK